MEGLFRLKVLADLRAERAAFCENGWRRLLAVAADDSLHLQMVPGETVSLPWTTRVLDMCFEPAGSWLLLLSAEPRLYALPALALLRPGQPADARWSPTRPSLLPPRLPSTPQPSALVWWQTEQQHSVAIVGDQSGGLTFISLESYKVIRRSYIVGKVNKLSIYINDDENSVNLLITSNKGRQWHLVLETRVTNVNHTGGKKKSIKAKDGKKFDDFLTTLKELGSDKMNSLFQIRSHSTSNVPDKFASQSNSKNPTPISLAATLADSTNPAFDEPGCANKNSRWIVSPQSAHGQHFVSIFNPNASTLTLHRTIEDMTPVYSYKFKNLPAEISKIIWEQKMIYLFGSNSVEIHSTHFSSQEDDMSHSILWSDFFEEDEYFVDAWSVNESSADPIHSIKWSDTSDVDNIDLPQFNLSSCLVITSKKIYNLSTSCDILKWVVDQLIEGQARIERISYGLQIPLKPLLISAADILLARKRFKQAMPMFRLAKLGSDDILNRLGALGFYGEMVHGGITPQSTKSADILLLVHILHAILDYHHMPILLNYIEKNNQYSVLTTLRILVDLGLWDAVNIISLTRGKLWPTFQILMEHSNNPCRGYLSTLLKKCYTQFLLTDDALPFLKFVNQYCETFDNELLKKLCVWMCPLQECFRIPYKALSIKEPNNHLSKMRRLIRTFFGVISTLHSRITSSKTQTLVAIDKHALHISMFNLPSYDQPATAENDFPCVISGGHNHWGIACNGKIKLISTSDSMAYVDIDTSLIGKIVGVACGRHHTLILSENGLYAMGNNAYGQLGIGHDLTATDSPLLIEINEDNCSDNSDKIIQIDAGQYHSACVTESGALYTWGWGIYGQLAHGTVYNHFLPKRVNAMRDKKVSYVGCGSCHTAILTAEGSLYLCGSGVFGQIASLGRQKSNLPLLIDLGGISVSMIAVGYYHTLALLNNNELWTWGSSPQKLRLGAKSAKRKINSIEQKITKDDTFIQAEPSTSQNLSSPVLEADNHMFSSKVNTSNVKGVITKISAGWHHSALLDDNGLVYVWGLNLDCQLGTGNCTELFVPTNVQLPKMDFEEKRHAALSKPISPSIACGGDFTVHVNSQGRIFVTGNTLIQKSSINEGEYKVFFKNSSRIIRVPNHNNTLQKSFRYVTVLEDTDYENPFHPSNYYKSPKNPVTSLESFDKPDWAVELFKYLHQFIDDDTPLFDNHLRALLSVLRNDYAEALNLQLNNLFQEASDCTIQLYSKHDKIIADDEDKQDGGSEFLSSNLKLLQDLVKSVCRKLLEEGVTESIIIKLDCMCNERKYLKSSNEINIASVPVENIESHAIAITRSLFNILPANSKIWTDCVDEATTFWIDHKLNMEDLEAILAEKVSDHKLEAGSALFCNTRNVDYQKHMSPSFNLELCNNILQSL